MKNKIIGAVALIVVIAAAGIWKSGLFGIGANSPAQVTLKGEIGSEKEGLLEDAQVKKILKDKYGVTLDYQKAGSIEMVQGNTQGQDFLFPSSQIAVELYKQRKAPLSGTQTVFNSPLVVYSWDDVTSALQKQGIVQQQNGSYYIVDMKKLVALMQQGKKWSEIGLGNLYGKIALQCTDPVKSNSGNLFSGLLASIYNNGQVVDPGSLQTVLPELKNYFAGAGYMQESSEYLFNQYMNTGEGAAPLIVGYESQMIEFAAQKPSVWNSVKSRVRILYCEPTVWSAHTAIALDDKAKVLLTALQDPELQAIAWKAHGFRTGVTGIVNDVGAVPVSGVPQQITSVLPTPAPQVMESIIQALSRQ